VENVKPRKVEKISIVFPPDSVGKLLFNKYVDPNTQKFILVLRDLTARHNNPETSKDFLDYIVKVATKTAFLYKQKQVTKDQIVALRFTFRRICSSLTNAFRIMDIQPITEVKLQRITAIFLKFKVGVCELLEPFISDRSLKKISTIFDYFASSDFLFFCFKEADTFKEIVYILSNYLDVN